MLEIRIRPYQKKDFNRLCEIHDPARKNELTLANLSEAFIPFVVASEREELFAYHVYVAEQNEKVIGFVAFSDDEIAWLYVDVAYIRKGIGKKLIEFALQNVNEDACIEVLKGNISAINLYSQFGFHISETLSGKMPGNEAFTITVHRMCR